MCIAMWKPLNSVNYVEETPQPIEKSENQDDSSGDECPLPTNKE